MGVAQARTLLQADSFDRLGALIAGNFRRATSMITKREGCSLVSFELARRNLAMTDPRIPVFIAKGGTTTRIS